MKRSIILLSGGLDSAVNTAIAKEKTKIIFALTFDYGQRSAKKEIEASRNITEYYKIPFRPMKLPWLGEITKSSLCSHIKKLPTFEGKLPDDRKTLDEIAKQVWVPNRNGLFINIAASFAESLDTELIITGFNSEEGVTFPDNSPQFIDAINQSLSYSTLKECKVHSYTSDKQKKDIVKLGMDMNVPFDIIYSCYDGDEKMCGKCESCLRAIKAFEENGCLEIIKRNFQG
ncbi:7-cyano-7-deazaguanine synthase QueC [bacterium]|nr:7-cyano-7-deazaguanine synthase QueC [bacterium]